MAKRVTAKQLANLRPVKKGEIRNKKGINASPLVQRLRKVTQHDVEEIGSMLVLGEQEKLPQIKDNPKDSPLRAMMASVAMEAIADGDEKKMNAILDRLIGKAKEKLEVSGADGGPVTTANLTSSERAVMLGAIVKKLKITEDE